MSPGLKTYRDLLAWQKAMDFVEETYKLSEALPASENYGLVSQMRRSAVSIPANIAQGYGRRTRGDDVRDLSIANGSLKELETHLTIAARLNMLPRDSSIIVWDLAQEVGILLSRLIKSLETPSRQP